ncbi:MAG: ABC transporter permease, partial [Bauldia litoralis]
MTATSPTDVPAPDLATEGSEWLTRIARSAEAVVIPLIAMVSAAVLFSIFLLFLGKSPIEFFNLLWVGGYGSAFSWTNTLVRAGPLIFTALCVAIPARLGMVVIGGEGAL